MTGEPCPCGSGRPFAACCGPFLHGAVPAPTAEALMRSRYTAYVRADCDYLRRTLFPRKREGFNAAATREWCAGVVWTGLAVLRTEAGGPNDEAGVVEFKTAFTRGGTPHILHEVSRFRKKNGEWFYVDGEPGGAAQETAVTRPASKPAVGRNDPCPCGSGKKYKRCCGA